MKRLLTLTLILTLATAMVVAAQPAPRDAGCCDKPCFLKQAKHSGGHAGMKRGNPGLRGILAHGDKINLTDEQRDKLENMMTEFEMQRVDRKADLAKAKIELKTLMRDEADQSAINAAIDKVAGLEANLKKARYTHQQEVKSVLTDEQKLQLKKLRQEMKCDGKRKPGGGRPGFGG